MTRKSFIASLIAVILVVGCRPIKERNLEDKVIFDGWSLREFEYRGHRYLNYSHSLIHAQHCQCLHNFQLNGTNAAKDIQLVREPGWPQMHANATNNLFPVGNSRLSVGVITK